MHTPIEQLDELLATESEPFAMATLVAASGSTPRAPGAKMWVGGGGRILGTMTIGGCVDARVVEAAGRVLGSGAAELLALSLGDEEAWEIGLTCGGAVEVLVERVDPRDAEDLVLATYRQARAAVERGESVVVAVPLEGNGRRRLLPPDTASGAGEGAGRVYLEPIAPPETVVIYGAGEIARALVPIAREVGMRTVVVDGRERFATTERFPGAHEIHVGMPSEIASRLPATPRSYVVLVAHDYKYELPVLRLALRGAHGYVGMLGSRRRGAAIRQLLREDGVSEDELARLRTPIGLDIGARSPAEIALAIAAEIIAVREGRR